jgi:uncharacterized protein YcbX
MPVFDVKVTDGRSTAITHMDLNFNQALALQKRFRRDLQAAQHEGWESISYNCLETGDLVRIRVSPYTRCVRVQRLRRRSQQQQRQQEMFA